MANASEDQWADLARRVARIEEQLTRAGLAHEPEPPIVPSIVSPVTHHSSAHMPPPLPKFKSAAMPAPATTALALQPQSFGDPGVAKPPIPVAIRAEAQPDDPRPGDLRISPTRIESLSHLHLSKAGVVDREPGESSIADRLPAESIPVQIARPRPRTVSTATTGVEQAIGLKVAGWIGAIVVVIGAALGIKFGYDQGWLGGMPDSIKLGILYAIGIGLIGAGEYVYRKINPLAAVGLYSAGIAGLFVVSYAGNAYYQLYDRQVAFALMAGACAIGAIISLRGGLVSIAILSLLGANLAPMILRDSAVGEVPLLVYLLALQVMAIGLAQVGKGARWWILRNFALISLSLWMTGRLAFSATAFSLPTLLFLCLYALLFQAENALAAWRRADGSFSYPTFSFAVTTTFTLALMRWSMPLNDMQRGTIMVGLSMLAFTLGAATVSSGSLKMRALAHGWIVQGGILLFAAVPIALAGPWIVIAWAVMALGYAILGVVLRRGRSSVGGVIVWCAALAYFAARLLLGSRSGPLIHTLFDIDGHPIATYVLIGLGLAAIGQAIALLVASRRLVGEAARADGLLQMLAKCIATIAAVLAAVILLAGLPPLTATLSLVALAWILLAIARLSNVIPETYQALSATAISLALAKWVAIDLIGRRLGDSNEVSTARLLFNSTMGVGVACVGSLWAITKLLTASVQTRFADHAELIKGAIVLGIASLTIGLSFELYDAVHRASESGTHLAWPPMQLTQFGWTMLWSIAAISIPWVGQAMGLPTTARTELKTLTAVILMLVSIKFLAIDALSYAFAERLTVRPIINAQTLTAGILLGLLIYSVRASGHVLANQVCRAAIFLMPLVIGSIELDRIFGPRRTLVAFSLYWGVYSIASIAVGFIVRSSVLRFAGLGLLGITLLKIVFVDLASAGTGWRILSFLGVGAILLATSVLYGRLSPKLLERGPRNEIDASDLDR